MIGDALQMLLHFEPAIELQQKFSAFNEWHLIGQERSGKGRLLLAAVNHQQVCNSFLIAIMTDYYSYYYKLFLLLSIIIIYYLLLVCSIIY